MGLFSELSKIHVRPDTSKIYFTYQDIQKLPVFSQTPLMELINGELYLPPSPNIAHHDISVKLSTILRDHLKSKAKIFNAPVDLVLSSEDVVIPDIIVIFKNKYSIITENNVNGIPDIIIEILSENRNHDLINKKQLYERYLIPEYIIVDNKNKQLIQHLLIDKSYSQKIFSENSEQALFKFDSISELSIDLKDLFI